MRKIAKYLWERAWYIGLGAVIAAALLLSLIQLLLPLAHEYRSDVEALLTDLLDQPVKIESMDASWEGMSPVLRLHEVQLFDDDNKTLLLRFGEARVGIDLWKSLKEGDLVTGSLSIVGAKISIINHKDGRITVEGFDLPAIETEGVADNVLYQWLFSQPELSIENGDVHWQNNRKDGRTLHFSNINMRLESQADDHIFKGNLNIPESLGENFEFVVEFTGDLSRPDAWVGELQARGTAIKISEWSSVQQLPTAITKGVADIDLTSEWSQGKLGSLEGQFNVSDLEFKGQGKSKPVAFDLLSGEFKWNEKGNWWGLDVENLKVIRNGSPWEETDLKISASKKDKEILIEGDYLRIQDISDLFLVTGIAKGEIKEALEKLQLRGDLSDVKLHYSDSKPALQKYDLNIKFRDLAMNSWKQFPTVGGLAGDIWVDGKNGEINLNASSMMIDIGLMFRDPVTVKVLAGKVAWAHEGGVWKIKSEGLKLKNDDLQGTVSMVLDIPDDGSSPYINMVAEYEGGKGASTSKYLPINVMSKESIAWLDESIIDGNVTWGGMLLRGKLSDFPFDNGKGKFEVKFNVTDAILDYDKAWPRIEEINGEVVFVGRTMVITAETGKILGSTVHNVTASIADLDADDIVVNIKGSADGSLNDVLQFIAKSPLGEDFGNYMLDLEVTGTSQLDLDMKIPVDDRPARLKGKLHFNDNSITMKGWDVSVKNVKGALDFTEDEMSAKAIKANLLGKPASVDVYKSVFTNKNTDEIIKEAVIIEASSRLSINDIRKKMDNTLLSYASGSSDWKIKLTIPETEWINDLSADLHIESDLLGITMAMPAPMGKPENEARKLTIDTYLIKDVAVSNEMPRRSVGFKYGKRLNGRFIIEERSDGVVVERGELSFAGEVNEILEPGVIVTGAIDFLNLDAWGEFLMSEAKAKKDAPDSSGTGLGELLNRVDLSLSKMLLLEQTFEKLNINIASDGTDWQAILDSKDLSGTIDWNNSIHSRPVKIALNRLSVQKVDLLDTAGVQAREIVDPRSIPAMIINSKEFIYNGRSFGSLLIQTSPYSRGMVIEKINIGFDEGWVSGFGDWVIEDGLHNTRLTMKIKTRDVGKTLNRFDFTDTFDSGTGKVEITAQWPASPKNFSLSELDGSLSMKLKRGRLIDIDPGAGRIFGLLSLSTLERRLTLDFSDLFKKGFAFDTINGEFEIEKGNAYTNDLKMEAPSATINLYGRIGLVAKDYDQYVSVSPKVTASLPLASALIGGPIVGAAVLAIERFLLKPGMEDVTRTEYTIRGTWDDPKVEPVKKPGQEDAQPQSAELEQTMEAE